MLTLVLVGSSASRAIGRSDGGTWVYTPRGYAGKTGSQLAEQDRGSVMTVHFIGAGPGDPDLLTIKARDLIARCPVCLYAGSLVPEAVVAHAPDGATVTDTAPLTLDQIIALIEQTHARGDDVARVHSGDPSLYGAIAEQIRRLDDLGIPFDITPAFPPVCGSSSAPRNRINSTRDRTDRHSDPDGHEVFSHASRRRTGNTRAIGCDAGDPPFDPQPARRAPGTGTGLWR